MKKHFFVLGLLFLGLSLNAQIINVPDVNFKTKLIDIQVPSISGNYAKDVFGNEIVIDTNNNGEIEVAEALTVSRLSLSLGNIATLEGIQSFTNLKSVEMFIITGLQNLDELNTLTGLTSIDIATCNDLLSLNFNPLINLNFVSVTTLNNLKSLYLKNGKNETIEISFMPALEFICADEIQIANVQSLVSLACVVNSYCSFTPGGTFYTIQGSNTYDSNGNGCESSDTAFPNTRFALTNGTITTNVISNTSGNYSVPVQAGTHTITPIIENPSYYTITPASASVTFPATVSPAIRNFCISGNGVHDDVEAIIIPINVARPGFNCNYKIIYKNKGTTTASGAVNLLFNDPVLDFITANPATTSQTQNNLDWSFSNLQPFETREILVTLNLNAPSETPPVNADFVLNYVATITAATDETPLDNSLALNQTVVNSFDPNDKTCLEGTTITPEMVGKDVHYMIRFENTGTAEAVNVVVKDNIDLTKFDLSSLVPLDASHPFVTRISGTNNVEFIFENINLPFDDANNDGYVVFKIKTKPTLVLGNTFSNSASIYFDFNFPIITNNYTTAVAVLGNQDFEFSSYFIISPNPAKDVMNIQTKTGIEVYSISIYNLLGQLVQVIPSAKDVSSIDVSSLKSGSYFIKILSDQGSSSSRFVKE